MNTDQLVFDENGLIPCIVQDFYSKQVLTLAWMNLESIDISLAERRTCFWSRSRRTLWRKGEQSGAIQHLVSLTTDCDADALLAQVIAVGPACHTGEQSCFYRRLFCDDSYARLSLQSLWQLLLQRKSAPVQDSYTSYLFEKGLEKMLKKVGEECSEVLIASMKRDRREMIFEISDLCYHVLVLMVECGVTPADILDELNARHIVDHKQKQETLQ